MQETGHWRGQLGKCVVGLNGPVYYCKYNSANIFDTNFDRRVRGEIPGPLRLVWVSVLMIVNYFVHHYNFVFLDVGLEQALRSPQSHVPDTVAHTVIKYWTAKPMSIPVRYLQAKQATSLGIHFIHIWAHGEQFALRVMLIKTGLWQEKTIAVHYQQPSEHTLHRWYS